MAKRLLTGQMENFCLAYVKLGVASAAYREAYNCERMKPSTVNRNAHGLMELEKVEARIKQLREMAQKEVFFGVAQAMRDAVDLHTADANDLVQVRRLNCRHCHGRDHLYQWRDPREFADALAIALDKQTHDKTRRGPKTIPAKLPTDDGGYGFRRTTPPHEDCPRCEGEGLEDIKVMDTRHLTGKARKLYAGAKVSKDGRIEILFRNQDANLERVMKALGMFTENVKILPPGAAPDGVPPVPLDDNEASRQYQAFIRGE